jgi:hypothetical protein
MSQSACAFFLGCHGTEANNFGAPLRRRDHLLPWYQFTSQAVGLHLHQSGLRLALHKQDLPQLFVIGGCR